MSQTIKHDFSVMTINTTNKDGKKYLGKNGEQAYRVSTKIGNDWYACQIYQEELIPKKGTTYSILLEDDGTWKNWSYHTLSKKEQILMTAQEVFSPSSVHEGVNPSDLPFTPKNTPQPIQKLPNPIGRGASYNLAFSMVLKNYDQVNSGNFDKFITDVEMWAEMISTYQDRFVNQTK